MLESALIVVWLLAGLAVFAFALSYLVRDYFKAEFKKDESLPEEESSVPRKMRIDPEDPPRVMIFNPSPVKGEDEYRCDCCNKILGKGQEVIWWPNPETGGVELYCPDKVDIDE